MLKEQQVLIVLHFTTGHLGSSTIYLMLETYTFKPEGDNNIRSRHLELMFKMRM